MSIASLPMYDLPELRAATDALWRGIAARLGEDDTEGAAVPEALVRGGSHEAPWSDPALLFSQTCGYPLTHALAGRVRLVATPCYRAAGCAGSSYRSLVVVRASSPARALADLRGAACVVNEPVSHSGMNALRALIAPLSEGRPFFSSVRRSGAHLTSLEMVGAGEADVAAIDCVTYALAARARPELVAGTRPIAWSAPAPACPYITRGDASDALVAGLQRALASALSAPELAFAREALLLDGLALLPASAYDRILALEAEAVWQGYATLA